MYLNNFKNIWPAAAGDIYQWNGRHHTQQIGTYGKTTYSYYEYVENEKWKAFTI